MKTFISIITCLLVTVFYAQAPEIEWQKSYGGSAVDISTSILQTSDGGFILGGSSESCDGNVKGNHGKLDYWIVKLDNISNIQWQKSLGGSGNDLLFDIRQTTDGGNIAAGYSYSNNGDVNGHHGTLDFADYWIVKSDNLGNTVWAKSYGGFGNDFAYSIRQTTDGGYIVAGSSDSNDGDVNGNHGYLDYWIVKLDNSGNIEWETSYGGSSSDWCQSIQQTIDGGYIAAGFSLSNDGDIIGNHGGADYWIVKFDNSGNIQWQKSIGGSYDDYASDITQTIDGGYIIAGETYSDDIDVSGQHGANDFWIVKLDNSGNIEWQKTLGGSNFDNAVSVFQTLDGYYIAAGSSKSNDGDVSGNHGDHDYWIVSLDNLGEIIWQKTIGGSGHEILKGVQQIYDGAYIIAGLSESNDGDVSGNHGDLDYWVVKLSPDNMDITEVEIKDEFLVYPNPADEFINIHSKNQLIDVVEILDMTGNIWMHQKLNSLKAKLNIAQLPKGVFVVKLKTQNNTVTRKIIKK